MAAGVHQSVFVLLVVYVGAARGKIVERFVCLLTGVHIVFYLRIYYLRFCGWIYILLLCTCQTGPARFRSARGRPAFGCWEGFGAALGQLNLS